MPDLRLKLPGDSAERISHPRRAVLIVSDQGARHGMNALLSSQFPSVLVVPLSTATTGRTRFDVRFAAGEANLPKKCWARVPALQPVDKDYLQDWVGDISGDKLDEVTARILEYLGIIPDVDDPAG